MKNITLGDLTFAVQDEGEGPAVLLLHGFPDSHALWRNQVPALVNAGYRVIAPDLRGFGDSSKPVGVEKYGILDIAGDVVGILDSLGVDRAHVVGHDWGAALAWAMAAFLPARVDHLVALSVGHPSAFGAVGFDQRQKSWYMLLFQFEDIAEQWLSANDFANMRAWSHHPDMDQIVVDLARPGCTHRCPQLVPRQRAPAHLDRASDGLPTGAGTDNGGVEQRRFRARREGHDRLAAVRRRLVAVRASRWPRALDAARSSGPRCRRCCSTSCRSRSGPTTGLGPTAGRRAPSSSATHHRCRWRSRCA